MLRKAAFASIVEASTPIRSLWRKEGRKLPKRSGTLEEVAVGEAETPIKAEALDQVAATLTTAVYASMDRAMGTDYAVEIFFEIRKKLMEKAPKPAPQKARMATVPIMGR
jgi:hypothetical protein